MDPSVLRKPKSKLFYHHTPKWTHLPTFFCAPPVALYLILRFVSFIRSSIGWIWYAIGFLLAQWIEGDCVDLFQLWQPWKLGSWEWWLRMRCEGEKRGWRDDDLADIVSGS